MKITDVKPLVLRQRFILVKVFTDEGIVGIGECSPMNAPVIVAMLEHALKPLVLGEDPFNIERLWNKMFYAPYKLGPMGAQLEAISGIDIALYDIVGKALGVPAYKLLGGAVRDKVEVYASSMRRDLTPRQEAERVEEFAKQGYRAYKMHSATPWMFDSGFDQTIKTLKAIRSLAGYDMDLLVDVNNAYTLHRAIQVGRQLEELKVFHFEEPIAAYDYAGYGKLVEALDIPIAAGEQEYTRWQHRDLITIGNVDIVQPDVMKSGGITETKKIALLADTYNKSVTVHNTQPTVGTAAHLHFWASTPNCRYPQEYNIEPHPLRDEYPILKEPLIVKDGFLDVPQGPGLGIELDEKAVAKLMEG